MNDIVISVKNISKCYQVFENQRARLLHALRPKYKKGMKEIWALKDINFEIKRGESVAIIGRNGGGKSTLLEILTGTLAPSTGTVEVKGRVSALLELGSGFNPEYSGRDNVMLNGLLLGLSREEILKRFDEILDFAEIGDAIDRPVKTYSSGMMMRLAFAVQVICDPDILIIDEALSVGDFFFQQKCLGYLRELCAKGTTLLFVSHDMGTVRDLCRRAIYLRQGDLLFDGSTADSVHCFLKEQRVVSKNHDEVLIQDLGVKDDSEISSDLLSEAIWTSEANEPGKIIAVILRDENMRPTLNFKMGGKVNIIVLFRPDPREINHIIVGLTNKFGQLVTATGSMQLNSPPLDETGQTELLAYKLELHLMIEAGNYAFEVTLCYATGANQGDRIDKTPSLGPIVISWDFESETAPFIGLMGLPAVGAFKLVECAEC